MTLLPLHPPVRPPWRHRVLARWYRTREHSARLRAIGWLKRWWGIADLVVAVRPGVVMELDESDFVQREILFHGAYEPASLSLLERLLGDASVFVDIGAHVGQYALTAAALLAGRGEVFAFEPTPKTAARLLHNVALSGATNLRVFALGVSDRGGLVHMAQAVPTNWGGTRITSAPQPGGHVVATLPLEEISRFAGWRRLDVVKIDVEGHEGPVLRALFAPGLPRPRHLLIEFRPGDFAYEGLPEGVPGFLRKEGYTLRDVTGRPYDPAAPLPEENLWAALD